MKNSTFKFVGPIWELISLECDMEKNIKKI
jgi:hypothetical protein